MKNGWTEWAATQSYDAYKNLCATITAHNQSYFEEHTPQISDEAYDQLLVQLAAIETVHPEWVDPSSPTQILGEKVAQKGVKVTHWSPMLSLEKVFSFNALHAFDQRMTNELVYRRYSIELKMDGCAIALRYNKGKFVQALTRGNGREGEDITHTIAHVPGFPKVVPCQESLEVRAEVFLPLKGLEQINRLRSAQELPLLANTRNATAGFIKRLKAQPEVLHHLCLAAYMVLGEKGRFVETLEAVWQLLRSWGFAMVVRPKVCQTMQEVLSYIDAVQAERHTLPFAIDGCVVKVDALAQQEKMGTTAKAYRWAVAYKFSAQKAETVVEQITLQMGRHGVLTPVALLRPVFVDGSTVRRCSLHNMEEITRLGIGCGATVLLEKAGDVIPKITKVVTEHHDYWQPPTTCPFCTAALLYTAPFLRCTAPRCPARVKSQWRHFVGKRGVDIAGVGARWVEQARCYHQWEWYAQLFTSSAADWTALEGVQEKRAEAFIAAIAAKRELPLATLLEALSIPHVGSEVATLLAQKYTTFDALKAASIDDLADLHGIGEEVAHAVYAFFNDTYAWQQITHLMECITLKTERVQTTEQSLVGMTFVITGTFQRMTRSNLQKALKDRGGRICSAVSRNTSYLLVGAAAGDKYQKARKLGIVCLDEEEVFTQLLPGIGSLC